MLVVGTGHEVAPALTRALPFVRQAELLLPAVAEAELELAAPPRCYRAVALRSLFDKHLARGSSTRASWPGELEVMLDGAQPLRPSAATKRGRHKRRRRGEDAAAPGGGPEQAVDVIVSAGPEDVAKWPDGARCVEELATGPFRTVMRGARVPLLESTREPTSREDDAEPRESGADAREESAPVPEADDDGFMTLGADSGSDSESDDADADDDARDGLGDASVALAPRDPLSARDALAHDLSDWLGAAACRLTTLLSAAPVDSFVRAFRLPCHGAFRLAEGAIDARRWKGMLSQRFVAKLAGQARAAARACGAPWAALTVWGFRGARHPARPSHEIRSFVVFAHTDECWLLKPGT